MAKRRTPARPTSPAAADTYLLKLERIVAGMPEKPGVPLKVRIHDAWTYYAELQMRTGMELHQCLTHARAIARKFNRNG